MKPDTRAVGLDVGLQFVRWLTGAENLHYGDWTGLDVTAANLRTAQEAYTERLFAQLPSGRLRICDIGGGAGETARKLLALGHSVDIVVPSALFARRCRENAPGARVFEMTFESFEAPEGSYDLCLFSESFQYIPMEVSLPKCRRLLRPGGHILIADCFRSESFRPDPERATVGDGHPIAAFRAAISDFTVEHSEDITARVSPSVDLEQRLFHVFGFALSRVEGELARTRPRLRWGLGLALKALISRRKRARLVQRLQENTRTSAAFEANNCYLIVRLRA